MDELKTLLTLPFNAERYGRFINEFFKNFEHLPLTTEPIPPIFSNHIKSYTVHGYYTDPNGKRIVILSVKVKNNSSAKQSQRNFAAYLLSNSFSQFNAAFVAYYDEIRTNWKLSFITVEYELGTRGVELKFQPAKRFSFLVGQDEPTRTYTQQLGQIYNSIESPSLEQISDAFSVNRLSKDFYEDYKKKFFELVEFLEKDQIFINEASRLGYENANKFAITFAKKTLGQMVFLHFIQKKGWLGVKEKWGDGDKRFLIHSTKSFDGDNYFNDFIEPLFYSALNKRRDNDIYLNTKIPFLNGGLFQPIEHYDWENTYFHIPNSYWYNKNETGLLDIFSQYNFTVDESDPTEQEVAVDPEMLGKIFESLLEVKDRAALGAFYTPREIVHYMCEEALAERIATVLGLNHDSVLNFIKYGDALMETDFIQEFASEIDDIVSKITVVDPAVGSGAFLVGMLNEIIRLRENLQKFTNNQVNTYDMKIQTIQNSLYGVDIEYDAVEIAKLRLWLSLIVDQDANESAPKPLPNLNFHLRVGNSLIEQIEGIELWSNDWKTRKSKRNNSISGNLLNDNFIDDLLESIKIDKKYFYSVNSDIEKDKLINVIEQKQLDLILFTLESKGKSNVITKIKKMLKKKTKPFFVWNLEFCEVFDDGGFDIVIANPPYIGEEGNKEIFHEVKKTKFGEKYYLGKMDYWYFFVSKGIELLKNKGILTFIAPNNWMTTAGGQKMRSHIAKETKILEFINFNNIMIFESACQQTMIFKLRKECVKEKYTLKCKELYKSSLDENSLNIFLNGTSIGKSYLSSYSPTINSDGRTIQFLNSKVSDVIERIISNDCLYLMNSEITNGIHPHFATVTRKMLPNLPESNIGDGIFVVNSEEVALMNISEKEHSLLKPYYDSTNIGRYYFNPDTNKYIIYTNSDFKETNKMINYPHIKAHLDRYVDVITSDNRPYGLHRARKESFFNGEKIISLRKCSRPTFSYIDGPSYVTAEWYVIKTNRINMKYLTILLNSNLIKFWLLKMGKMQGKNFQVDKDPIVKIPIVLSDNSTNEILSLYDKIDTKSQETNPELEKRINSLVYSIYGIDKSMRDFIEHELSEFENS